MPWKEWPVSEQRLVVVHQILSLHRPVTEVARESGISRKTAYKWRDRYQCDQVQSLLDRSRRPKHSPRRTAESVEQAVLAVRRQYNWGPRKIHRLLSDQQQQQQREQRPPQLSLPSIRTVAAI